MGRSLPTECDHGVVVDWGDFGPTCPAAVAAGEAYTEYCADPVNCESCYQPCAECEARESKRQAKRDDLRRRALSQAKYGDYWAQKVLDLLDGKL